MCLVWIFPFAYHHVFHLAGSHHHGVVWIWMNLLVYYFILFGYELCVLYVDFIHAEFRSFCMVFFDTCRKWMKESNNYIWMLCPYIWCLCCNLSASVSFSWLVLQCLSLVYMGLAVYCTATIGATAWEDFKFSHFYFTKTVRSCNNHFLPFEILALHHRGNCEIQALHHKTVYHIRICLFIYGNFFIYNMHR